MVDIVVVKPSEDKEGAVAHTPSPDGKAWRPANKRTIDIVSRIICIPTAPPNMPECVSYALCWHDVVAT